MRLRHGSCLFLVLVLTVGHSAGLQVLAWTGMLASRLANRSLTEAVTSTFDGSEPCVLCRAASDLNEAEQGPFSPLGEDQGPRAPVKTAKPDFAQQTLLPVTDLIPVSLGSLPAVPDQIPLASFRGTPEPPPPRV